MRSLFLIVVLCYDEAAGEVSAGALVQGFVVEIVDQAFDA